MTQEELAIILEYKICRYKEDKQNNLNAEMIFSIKAVLNLNTKKESSIVSLLSV